MKSLKRLCSEYGLTPQQMAQKPLKEIETMTEEFIYKYMQKDSSTGLPILSPKYLNLIYSSIKKWCLYQGIIKNRKYFAEIIFDKTSRKTRDSAMITHEQFKKMFDHANLKQKLILGYYGIQALRPSLILYLKLADIHPDDVTFNKNGTISLEEKPWILIKREYIGNKGNIDFPTILTPEMSQWQEDYLNSRIRKGEDITEKSKLVCVNSKDVIDYNIKKLFALVGFKGRKYLLRHYAYKRFKQAVSDYDFREWLMGHRGKVSAIYDHGHYLTNEEINQYKSLIDTKVLEIYALHRPKEEIIDARIVTIQALLKDLDVNATNILKKDLITEKITIDQFNRRLTELAQDSMNKQMETKFEQLFLKMNKKYNGK